MTRITLSELKGAIRSPGSRRAPQVGGIPTPMPSAMSAVRRFHGEGAAAAVGYLNQTFSRSSYWGPGGRPQATAWANAVMRSFDNYVALASADDRPVLPGGVACDVQVGTHTIGVSVDVVLLDAAGYVARHVLWDVPELSQDDAELQAAPIVVGLEAELGPGRVVGVEVWHLRSGSTFFVAAGAAIARLAEVEQIVEAFLADS